MTAVIFLDVDCQPLRVEPWTRAITDLFLQGPVVQREDAGVASRRSGFESPQVHTGETAGRGAWPCKPSVVGSIPTLSTSPPLVGITYKEVLWFSNLL